MKKQGFFSPGFGLQRLGEVEGKRVVAGAGGLREVLTKKHSGDAARTLRPGGHNPLPKASLFLVGSALKSAYYPGTKEDPTNPKRHNILLT